MMGSPFHSLRSPLMLACIAGVVGLGATALRAPAGAAEGSVPYRAPANIGLVNLDTLMDKLEEAKAKKSELESKGKDRQAQLDEIVNRLKKAKQDLDLLPPDSPQRIEKGVEVIELQAQAEGKKNALQTVINIENGKVVKDLYLKVVAAAERLAQKEGLDLVMMDDRVMELPPGGSDRDMNMAIQSKRVLFAQKGMEVTEQLATLMNNEYNAPKTTPKAPAANPPKKN